MRRAPWWAGACVVLAAAVVARADDAKSKDAPPKADAPPAAAQSPAEQYQALVKEYMTKQEEFSKEYRQAKTPEERRKVIDDKYPKPQDYTGKFLALAKEHPQAPTAADALVWVATNDRGGAAGKEATDILLKDHLTSDKIGQLCQTLAYGPASAVETLRTILAKNPHKPVQAMAAYSLAQQLKRRGDAGEPLATQEAEQIFERIVKEFADVKYGRGTLGKTAEGELNEIRLLSVGKVAPEIEGEDIDGVKFKLSDYRGKVVLLDFWGHW